MGVSRRSYAAQRGVSEAAVRKAIATGRITTLTHHVNILETNGESYRLDQSHTSKSTDTA